MLIHWELNAMNAAGDGYEICRWRQAEEYCVHLNGIMCSAVSNWQKVPDDFTAPFGAEGHTFWYRKVVK